MENILATFTNADDAIEARIVAYHKGGFSVALFDLDVNDSVGCKIIADYDAAVAYAKSLVV